MDVNVNESVTTCIRKDTRPALNANAGRQKEKRSNVLPKFVDRFSAIDCGSQVRTVVVTLRVIRAERTKLVDDPPIVRSGCRVHGAGCRVAESFGLAYAFVHQQVDIVE